MESHGSSSRNQVSKPNGTGRGSALLALPAPTLPPTAAPMPRSEWMDITPAIATEMLTKNHNNRPVRESNVRRLEADLRAGTYELTHQGIAFDVDGFLADGQHRLTAIVRSGVTARMQVTWGLPRRARAVIDTGDRRSLAQILAMQFGVKSAKRVCSWLYAIELLERNTGPQLSVDELLVRLERHRAGIDWAVATFHGDRALISPVVGALVYAHPAAPEKVGVFGAALTSLEGLTAGAPAHTLLHYLQRHRREAAATRRDTALRTLRAVLGHIKGESLTILHPREDAFTHFRRFHEEGEASAP